MIEIIVTLGLIVASLIGTVVTRLLSGRMATRELKTLRLLLPSSLETKQIQAFFTWLTGLRSSDWLEVGTVVSVELVAERERIEFFITLPKSLQRLVQASLRSCLPGIRIDGVDDPLVSDSDAAHSVGVELGFTSSLRPLKDDEGVA